MRLKKPRWFIASALLAASAGCSSFSMPLEPTNTSIADAKEGRDCRVLILGIGGHEHGVAAAMRQGGMTKLRSAEYQEKTFMGCGTECVVARGE
ncbi:MAG TPA: hypothetical protein VJ746_02090 [Nitrospira sp.]|nr:hypothetical protein [Nitrospira sp.]